MIGLPFAHVGGIPIEETLGSFGPALLRCGRGGGVGAASRPPARAELSPPPSPPPACDAGPRGRAGRCKSNDNTAVSVWARHTRAFLDERACGPAPARRSLGTSSNLAGPVLTDACFVRAKVASARDRRALPSIVLSGVTPALLEMAARLE